MTNEQRPDALDIFGAGSNPPGIFNPYQIHDRVYKNQQVDIDGYHFTNCAFISCTLNTSKGNFSFNNCYFAKTNALFGGNAQRVVRLLSLYIKSDPPLPEGLRAVIDPDFAVTVR
jgi:hypothetical protein